MQNKRRRNKVSKFIPNLHKILSNEDSGANWREDGKSFVLNDISKLIANSLTKYFRHSNISSFIRQLNLYGFKKIVGEEISENTYFHEKFKKNYITQLKPLRSFYNRQKYGRTKKTKKSQTDPIEVQSVQSNIQPDCVGKTVGFSVPSSEFYSKEKIAMLEKQNQRLKIVEQEHLQLLNYLDVAHRQMNLYQNYNFRSNNNLFNFLPESKRISVSGPQTMESYSLNTQGQCQSWEQFYSFYQSAHCFPFQNHI